MKPINYYHHIYKGIHMEIIKSDIQITITKAQLIDLITEALTTDAGNAIKRAITPMLADSFPQFPEFSNITIGDTDESGQTTITLRKPREVAAKPKSDLKSMEPLNVVTPDVDAEPEPDL
jgi:hypothetical protein